MNTSPDFSYLLFGLSFGIAIGAIVRTMLFRRQAVILSENARLEFEAERASLKAKIESTEARLLEIITTGNNREVLLGNLNAKLYDLNAEHAALEMKLEKERESTAEKLAVIDHAKQQLGDAFASLSRQALDNNNRAFIDNAEQVLKRFQTSAQADLAERQQRIQEIIVPVRESLDKVDIHIKEVEKERGTAYAALREQLMHINSEHQRLATTTSDLAGALRNTRARGQWGEIQLKRVVELAGMTNFCDFTEQVTVDGEDGRLRPDMIINLPSNRTIVVDSKTPMDSYLEAHHAADDAARQGLLVRHAQSLRTHVAQLGRKAYWESFEQSPEFVVMFLPNESVFSAALDMDPKLFEFATSNNVIIATPSTLIAVLRASAQGWRHESVAREVKQVGQLGRELYSRLSTMTEHISRLGSALTNSAKAYNSMIGSLENRVLPTARKFKELDVVGESKGEIAELSDVEVTVRMIREPDVETLFDEEILEQKA